MKEPIKTLEELRARRVQQQRRYTKEKDLVSIQIPRSIREKINLARKARGLSVREYLGAAVEAYEKEKSK